VPPAARVAQSVPATKHHPRFDALVRQISSRMAIDLGARGYHGSPCSRQSDIAGVVHHRDLAIRPTAIRCTHRHPRRGRTGCFAVCATDGCWLHGARLCASIWCLVALVTAAAGPRQRLTLSLLLAGVFFGIAFVIRPFSAVALLWPAVLWCLLRQRSLGSSWWLVLGWMTFGALPGILLVFTYNGLVFGSPAQTGYQVDNPSVTLTLQLVQTPIAILGQQLPGISSPSIGFCGAGLGPTCLC
jgi:hypothetical protein